MEKILCDRCKKDITHIGRLKQIELLIKNDWFKSAGFKNDGFEYHKTLCRECANDIMNFIDYECDRYKLKTFVEEDR